MVRMVHLNLFYNMDFKVYDPTNQLWSKAEISEGQHMKNQARATKFDISDGNDFKSLLGYF